MGTPHRRPAQLHRIHPRPHGQRLTVPPGPPGFAVGPGAGHPQRTEQIRRPRYPSDTSNAEWALIEPLLPPPACETSRGGRPEKHPRREIVDAIRYVVDTGCKWRALSADYPPWRTAWGFMAPPGRGRRDRADPRPARRPDPPGDRQRPRAVATVIDSQSVKAAKTVGKDSHGYDAGKKINGRKRHLVVDTRGLPLLVMVTPADPHDSAAAKEVLFRLRLMHPEITIVGADRAYAGKLVTWAKQHLNLTIKTVSRPKDTSGFVVLPRRWVVERSLAWITQARRHARDYERLVQHSETLITWAAITLMTRRLTRKGPRAGSWTKRPEPCQLSLPTARITRHRSQLVCWAGSTRAISTVMAQRSWSLHAPLMNWKSAE
ncbi:IS5 family transposase [Streptomyces scopuliridis]|uniref:IS5 family transposase n=1 Tax=Streptomyces scopuliridis TaxID=452529 RepID=A0ACD4ZBP8_9ACTN|nr:IS5 family transposase [Streptomyces scopuliridis]WSB95792.1 IS5 family transposase [Streptomyces scopuliridis]WSC10501.1 IS5 family transposase [Streptomyces scopuliridis]